MTEMPQEIRSFEAHAAEQAVESVDASALIRRVRWHTGLSREDFARAFCIDMGQLSALERGDIEPDSALVAYLTVIDHAPEVVSKALGAC